MIYRKLGQSDLMCSVVGLGTWGMGGDSWAGSGAGSLTARAAACSP